MSDLTAYGGLFLAALVAATLLPAQSELVLVGLRASGYDAVVLVAVATAGNVLGSTINWVLGRYLLHFRDRRWFPVTPAMLDRATGWYGRWGVWSLLLAWMPVVGDPLTLVAGILRVDLRLFLPLVTLGKAARYAALAWAV
ncbi:YqaA family protein [Azospirillum sp.]|uniref:YqaA family protein n=1 Tax=Azospirillum sp. TaxID=34012 RepID=UPI002D3B4E68|nr:YqaA family protein [Azospirillum sp.]HYD67236.1 YqaA family protein [Azospirillum sp.]